LSTALENQTEEGDYMKTFWPWLYAGLEPLDKKRRDRKRRHAAAFHALPYDRKASDSVSRDILRKIAATTEL
jgi:hypothetical protein